MKKVSIFEAIGALRAVDSLTDSEDDYSNFETLRTYLEQQREKTIKK